MGSKNRDRGAGRATKTVSHRIWLYQTGHRQAFSVTTKPVADGGPQALRKNTPKSGPDHRNKRRPIRSLETPKTKRMDG